jgi:hypothetical protein
VTSGLTEETAKTLILSSLTRLRCAHDSAVSVTDLRLPPGNRLERLGGARNGQRSGCHVVGEAGPFDLLRHRVAVRVAEGVATDDPVLARVLQALVVQRLFMDLAAPVAQLHRAEVAAVCSLDRHHAGRSRTCGMSRGLTARSWSDAKVAVPLDEPSSRTNSTSYA